MVTERIWEPVDVVARAVDHRHLLPDKISFSEPVEVDPPGDLLPGPRVAPGQPSRTMSSTVAICRRGVRHLGAGLACETVPSGTRPVRVVDGGT